MLADLPRDIRPAMSSIKRGMLSKCPSCGEGKLFVSFIKPVDQCAVCAEDFTHQQADDLPAYLVVTLIGHIVLGGFLLIEALTQWPDWMHFAIWVPVVIFLSLVTLQPIKGGVIALQWAKYMHGFGDKADKDTHHR